jgi:hypothetical protein
VFAPFALFRSTSSLVALLFAVAPFLCAAPSISQTYGKLPISFEPNGGQTDHEAKFLARGRGYTLFVTDSGATLRFHDSRYLRMTLSGASQSAKLSGVDLQPGKSHYLIGSDPEKFLTDVPHYSRIRAEEVYPGVDLIYYGNTGQLEYDFVLAPGADPRKIRMKFEGHDKMRLDANGDLVITVGGAELRQQLPKVYQQTGSGQRPVSARYRLRRNEISAELGDYDKRRPLVIDPVLVYSTYLGGSGDDFGYAIAVDAAGNAYVAGSTTSTDFPKKNPQQPNFGTGTSAFIAKLNPTGTALVYSTYFGGTTTGTSPPAPPFQAAYGIAVDSSGSAYLTGETDSNNFPTTSGAYKTAIAGCYVSAFVSKLNPAGSGLTYSTLVCGNVNRTFGRAIAIDGAGAAYITGNTSDPNFPVTASAFQKTNNGNDDVFVTKLNATGTGLVYSTFLGAISRDIGYGIAVDSAGNAYVTGRTENPFGGNPPFPTLNPIQGTIPCDCESGFVTKMNSTGSALVYSTFLSGTDSNVVGTEGRAIAVDASGNAVVTGFTSQGFPLQNPSQAVFGGGQDAFVAKIHPSGQSLIFSTYLGGNGDDQGSGVAIDALGAITVTGSASSNFPVVSAIQKAPAATPDAFVARFSPTGTLLFSTYLGGSGFDSSQAVALDAAGAAYVVGQSASHDFFVSPSGFQPAFGGGNSDVFVAKIDPAAPNCSYTLAYQISSVSSSGGPGSVGVTTPAGCLWRGSSNVDWITVAGPPAAGNGLLNFTVAANSGASTRIGTIAFVDGQTVTVFQSGTNGCVIKPLALGSTVNGSLVSTDCQDVYYFTASAGQQVAIELTAPVIDTELFLYKVDGTSIAVNDDILRYNCHFDPISLSTVCDVAISDSRVPGTGFLSLPSSGTYYIGATSYHQLETGAYTLRLMTPDSSNCVFQLSPLGLNSPAVGGTGSVTVSGGTGCSWFSTAPYDWITLTSGLSGNGPGSVTYRVAPNASQQARSKPIAIANQLFFVSQDGTGCTFSLSSNAVTLPQAGGNGNVTVTTSSTCSWSAIGYPDWVTFPDTNSGVGNGTLNFTIAANPGAGQRAGTFVVGGQTFTITQAGTAGTVFILNPPLANVGTGGGPGTIAVTVTPSATSWMASSNVTWVTITSGATGSGNGTVNYSVAANPGPQARSGNIAIGGQIFIVNEAAGPPDTTPPFGSFDTPIDGATNVVGAVGVTGWALDNVGVTKVEIYRDARSGEAKGNFGYVFIGTAVFVKGARPDVQALYPNLPNANRAGWGYQLLTNFLPNSGNGTFKLHAIAFDGSNNTFEIGPGKTIVCTNASAAKPFGTIDTPGQGETISGTNYVNFAWALTPGQAFKIPVDGSTISVVIDGVPLGSPTYNQFRSDIASLFPGYTNSQGAVGYSFLDTTKFTDGVHAISWNVFDNASRGEGIGSRYFTVANGAANQSQEAVTNISAGRFRPVQGFDASRMRKRTDGKVFLRRSALNGPLVPLTPGEDGSYSIFAEQLERLELHLGAVRDGYLRVGEERQILPVGSTLDPETGIFYWQTAAPFLGDFDLVFTTDRANGEPIRVRVKITAQSFR